MTIDDTTANRSPDNRSAENHTISGSEPTQEAAVVPHLTQLRVAGGLGFLSGQVALEAGSSRPLGDAADQTRTILTRISALLGERGLSMANVAQVSVYLTDPAHFGAMNGVYAEFFPTLPPARTTTCVALVHPELLVEIDAVVDLSAGAPAILSEGR